jgi:hypothetical protein
LSLLNNLCAISESVIIKKEKKENSETENLLVQRTNNSKTVAYRFTAPVEHFNFEGDNVAFYKFAEFFQLVSCFDTPTLDQKDNRIIISKDKSKITYLSSDSDTIMKGPSKISFSKPDIVMEFKGSEIKDIRKMIGLLTAENTRFSCNDQNINITLYNKNHDNSFTKTYTPLKSVGKDEVVELAIASEIFTLLPEGDYTVEIKKEGIVKFSLKKENVSLELFTAEIDED